jgi:phenylacetate-CoA ligase
MYISRSRFAEVAQARGLDKEADLGLVELGSGADYAPDDPTVGEPFISAGLEAFGPLGGPCMYGMGAHLNLDHAYVEIVDPATHRPVEMGKWGKIVVTTFGRDSCMLRYDLEEAARIEDSPCPCGESWLRGYWGGRYKDIISVQGSQTTPMAVSSVLQTLELGTPSVEYLVVRPSNNRGTLLIIVEAVHPRPELAQAVGAAIRERLGIRADVRVVDPNSLSRSGYKQARVVDDIPPELAAQ